MHAVGVERGKGRLREFIGASFNPHLPPRVADDELAALLDRRQFDDQKLSFAALKGGDAARAATFAAAGTAGLICIWQFCRSRRVGVRNIPGNIAGATGAAAMITTVTMTISKPSRSLTARRACHTDAIRPATKRQWAHCQSQKTNFPARRPG